MSILIPTGAETDKTRLLIITDLRPFLNKSCAWKEDGIHSILKWAVPGSKNNGLHSVLIAPKDPITSDKLLDSNYESAWQRALAWAEYTHGIYVDVELALYNDRYAPSNATLMQYGDSNTDTIRIDVYCAEYNYLLSGLGLLQLALEQNGFSTGDFASHYGIPLWNQVRSEQYEEIVVIDDHRSDSPTRYSAVHPALAPAHSDQTWADYYDGLDEITDS